MEGTGGEMMSYQNLEGNKSLSQKEKDWKKNLDEYGQHTKSPGRIQVQRMR